MICNFTRNRTLSQVFSLEYCEIFEPCSSFTERPMHCSAGMMNFSDVSKRMCIYTAQKMKFSIKDFFSKCDVVEKLFPGSFLINQNWVYLWINILKFYIFCLIICKAEDYRKWLKLSYIPFVFTSFKVFLENKKRPETSLPPSFSAWFLEKKFSLTIFY